jgi:DNA-binding transcriptional MerR regulator
MKRDGTELLSIGQLARRTGLTVKTIRYWSDMGVVPPADRTPAGYRLYDARAMERLDLVRTLRELGVGIEQIHDIVRSERSLAEVAALHARALDAQIRILRIQRAVLRSVAARGSSTEEITLMNKLARLSAEERNRIVHDFVEEVLDGLDLPAYRERMLATTPDLPEDPRPEQVDAWIELAELVGDPDFRAMIRRMTEYTAEHSTEEQRNAEYSEQAEQAVNWVSLMGERVQPLIATGTPPESSSAAPVVDELMGIWAAHLGTEDTAAFRQRMLAGVEVSADPRHKRYWELLAVINDQPAPVPAELDPAMDWWFAAMRAHPTPGH